MELDWEQILKTGTDEITDMITSNMDVIAKLYEKGERKDAVDINLKFRVEPIKSKADDVKVKTGISLTTDRIKENREKIVSPQIDALDGAPQED